MAAKTTKGPAEKGKPLGGADRLLGDLEEAKKLVKGLYDVSGPKSQDGFGPYLGEFRRVIGKPLTANGMNEELAEFKSGLEGLCDDWKSPSQVEGPLNEAQQIKNAAMGLVPCGKAVGKIKAVFDGFEKLVGDPALSAEEKKEILKKVENKREEYEKNSKSRAPKNPNTMIEDDWKGILNNLEIMIDTMLKGETPDGDQSSALPPPDKRRRAHVDAVPVLGAQSSALPLKQPERFLARLMAGGTDALIEVPKIETPQGVCGKPGVLWQGSGAWKAPKSIYDPDPPPVTFGPFDVAAGGKARVEVNGFPPVPNIWSLGNYNTVLCLSYAMSLGSGFSPASEIAVLCGLTDNNKLTQEVTWDAPGRFWVTIRPPRGSGPLMGGFFDQSWNAKIKILSLNRSGPARVGAELKDGDTLRTGAEAAVVIATSRLIVEPHTTVTFAKGRDAAIVCLQEGVVRSHSQSASGKKRASAVAIRDRLGNTIQSAGTDFIVRQDKDISTVCVMEGRVSIVGADKKKVVVEAGQQCELPAGKLSAYQHDPTKDSTIGGIRAGDILLDDQPIAPAEVGLPFANGKFGAGWVWENPKNDATVETSKRGVLKITVPDGNEFWDRRADAPRLLHKVTGDFDLGGELLLTSKATDHAITEFILYAPGEYLGFHAKQMSLNGLVAQYRILGGGWVKMQGCNKLIAHATPFREGPDAPDNPIKLLLTRRGDLWRTYWSADGKQWNLSTRQVLEAPDTVWVGWLFKRNAYDNMHDEPAVNTLCKVNLRTARRGTLPPPAWDLIQWCGSAKAQEKTGRLSVAGSRTGWVRATLGQRIEGDFELVVRLTAPPWTHQPGENRGLYIFADADDDANFAYIRLTQRDDVNLRTDTDLRKDGRYGRYRWLDTKDYQVTFRLLRHGTAISTYYKVGGKWEQLDQFDAGFQIPVFLGICLDTTERATKAVPLAAGFKIEKLVASGLLA